MSFDAFLTERGMAPLKPSTAQETAPAKLAALEAALGVAQGPPDAVAARLAAVEQAEEARKLEVRALEIAHYTFKRATEAGIDPGFFDGLGLMDEKIIDAKIAALAELAAKAGALAVKEHWGANASRPGPAMSPPRAPATIREFEAEFEALSTRRR